MAMRDGGEQRGWGGRSDPPPPIPNNATDGQTYLPRSNVKAIPLSKTTLHKKTTDSPRQHVVAEAVCQDLRGASHWRGQRHLMLKELGFSAPSLLPHTPWTLTELFLKQVSELTGCDLSASGAGVHRLAQGQGSLARVLRHGSFGSPKNHLLFVASCQAPRGVSTMVEVRFSPPRLSERWDRPLGDTWK
jgi:hypothetical protein